MRRRECEGRNEKEGNRRRNEKEGMRRRECEGRSEKEGMRRKE